MWSFERTDIRLCGRSGGRRASDRSLVEEGFHLFDLSGYSVGLGGERGERGGPVGDRGTVPGESVAGMAVLVIATAVVGLLAVLSVRMVWRHRIIQLRGRFR
jgi:hypothetical protein